MSKQWWRSQYNTILFIWLVLFLPLSPHLLISHPSLSLSLSYLICSPSLSPYYPFSYLFQPLSPTTIFNFSSLPLPHSKPQFISPPPSNPLYFPSSSLFLLPLAPPSLFPYLSPYLYNITFSFPLFFSPHLPLRHSLLLTFFPTLYT